MYSFAAVRAETNKNFVILGTIIQCGYNDTGEASIFHCEGNKILISTNSTNTRCAMCAGYSLLGNTADINFCCFISNDNQNYVNCMCHTCTSDSFVKRSVFKNNTCKIESYWGLLTSSYSNVTVSESIFLENIASYTFCAEWYGFLAIINCAGDDLSASSAHGIVNSNEIKTNHLKLEFSFLSLDKCEANNPYIFEYQLIPSKKKRFSFNLILESFLNIKK